MQISTGNACDAYTHMSAATFNIGEVRLAKRKVKAAVAEGEYHGSLFPTMVRSCDCGRPGQTLEKCE